MTQPYYLVHCSLLVEGVIRLPIVKKYARWHPLSLTLQWEESWLHDLGPCSKTYLTPNSLTFMFNLKRFFLWIFCWSEYSIFIKCLTCGLKLSKSPCHDFLLSRKTDKVIKLCLLYLNKACQYLCALFRKQAPFLQREKPWNHPSLKKSTVLFRNHAFLLAFTACSLDTPIYLCK